MSYLTWRSGSIQRRDEEGYRIVHVCQAPVEALFVDDTGLLALTERGVERISLPQERQL